MKKIRVLLVDDQVLFVESLETVLKTRSGDLEIIGIAHNGQEAIELVANNFPDVVLMDIRMPVMNGVESTRKITSDFPDVKVLVLTTFDDDEYVVEALKYGAYGYLMKDVPPAELIAAIRAVHQGGIMISPKVASKLIKMVNYPVSLKSGMEENLDDLSEREQEVLKLMARGLDNKEIANKLFIAEQTVKNYVSTIYSKLGVHDRVQATLLAMKKGLV
jgi:DNA-binding NarL/FixJ family response regulator